MSNKSLIITEDKIKFNRNSDDDTVGEISCDANRMYISSSDSLTTTINGTQLDFNTDGTHRWSIQSNGHIIPSSNADYDLGNAEYKVRHLFLSDSSDARLKNIDGDYRGGLEFVKDLHPVNFTWKDGTTHEGKQQTGLIAQEVKSTMDKSRNYKSFRLWSENSDGIQGLDQQQLIPVLISAIKELEARVKELELREN